jgi:hypothetical protein
MGASPQTPGIYRIVPIPRLLEFGLNETECPERHSASVLDPGSALGLLPSIALSSAQAGDIITDNRGLKRGVQ